MQITIMFLSLLSDVFGFLNKVSELSRYLKLKILQESAFRTIVDRKVIILSHGSATYLISRTHVSFLLSFRSHIIFSSLLMVCVGVFK